MVTNKFTLYVQVNFLSVWAMGSPDTYMTKHYSGCVWEGGKSNIFRRLSKADCPS